uniref:Ig-like domain-containing protein n=1 Tax=Eptatretus burgeri TaxID=7764 RepID=A0A8C4QDM5_EPTBU
MLFVFPTGSQTKDTYNCTIEVKPAGIKIELCAQRNVIGFRGEDVVLPCLFECSKQNTLSNLHLLFVKDKLIKENPKLNLVYNSSSKYTSYDFKGRIEPVGNPSSGDGSLQIRDLRMEDERTYVCRFQWTNSDGREEGFESRHAKRPKLQVDVHPKILRIQSDFNSSTSWGLLCQAKAKPSPNITWLNPQGHLINEGEATVVAMDQNKIRYVSFLNRTEDDPEGNYTCLVKNKDGTTTGNVIFDIPFCKALEEVLWFFIFSSVSLLCASFFLLCLIPPFHSPCKSQFYLTSSILKSSGQN